MSELIVEVCKIEKAEHHPNADRLDVVQVKGWNCIVGRDEYKVGDYCLYIPIDAILPDELEATLFEGTKVKLSKHRVKTAKIRGVISQGLVINPEKVGLFGARLKGEDVAGVLGITKYEPPRKPARLHAHGSAPSNRHPNFTKYTNINHLNNYPTMLEGKVVAITEKIHGTNFRCGWLPYIPRTLSQKLKNLFLGFFNRAKKWDFIYGSHNVQIKDISDETFYSRNVYSKIVKDHNLKQKLINQKGRIFYGEIYGSGIQKGYDYGLGSGDIDVAWFDIKQVSTGRYLGYQELKLQLLDLGFRAAPELFIGSFDRGLLTYLCSGQSVLSVHQRFREGIVVKAVTDFNGHGGRSVLKLLNPDYLMLKGNSEWH